ncbi:MAG: PASTA domain-containing protein [Armatimonadetes bacterium]|nr:PASTA domain-containing protein [Armatimonadota bacterium]
MTGAAQVPDVLALPVDEAVEHLKKAGWTVVAVKATAAPGVAPAPAACGRVARVKVVGERGVEIVYVEAPRLRDTSPTDTD